MSKVLNYEIYLTPLALATLVAVSDPRDQAHLRDRIQQLCHHPDHQGTPLIGKLFGYRSIKVIQEHYRIIYRIENDTIVVFLVGDGQRNTVREIDLDAVLKRFVNR